METSPDTQGVVQVAEGLLVLENMYMGLKSRPKKLPYPVPTSGTSYTFVYTSASHSVRLTPCPETVCGARSVITDV